MVVLACLGVAACGTSSGQDSGSASTLLDQTFSGVHKISSGDLNLALTIDAAGSSTLNGPITLSFGGPFENRGTGKLPESNFTVSANALGHSVSLGILSTGTNGYVTLQGKSYQLPAATFQKLESSFSQSAGGSLPKLGIHPLRWLSNPTVVGPENVGGVPTTHIHAGVNVSALLSDLSGALSHTSAIKSGGISASTRQQIAAAVSKPSVDVWTGTNDKTIRRLTVALTLGGKAASAVGGAQSVDVGLTVQYANLNQPQTITAPTSVRPYSEFQAKVNAFVQQLQAATGLLGAAGKSSSGTGAGAGSASSVQKYSQCVQQAGGDVAKMQKCASLLGSSGG